MGYPGFLQHGTLMRVECQYEPRYLDRQEHFPTYETEEASGVDLAADIKDPITFESGESALIPTGFSVNLPDGMEAQVRPRSGLAYNDGVTVLNSPGTIDSDYRGDVGVILINHSNGFFTVEPGDRIAQLVFAPVVYADLSPKDELDDSERGEGGFGSTGK